MPSVNYSASTGGWAGNQASAAWATIRAANGNIHRDEDTPSTSEALALRASTVSNEWNIMRRGLFSWDTSTGIPAGATITGITLRLYVNSKDTSLASQSILVTSATLGSNTTLNDADYQANATTTAWSAAVNLSDITAGQYNEWTLNGTGIAGLNTSGFTQMGLRFSSEHGNSEPSWSSSAIAEMNFDFPGGTNPPQLVVSYTLGGEDGQHVYFM